MLFHARSRQEIADLTFQWYDWLIYSMTMGFIRWQWVSSVNGFHCHFNKTWVQRHIRKWSSKRWEKCHFAASLIIRTVPTKHPSTGTRKCSRRWGADSGNAGSGMCNVIVSSLDRYFGWLADVYWPDSYRFKKRKMNWWKITRKP